jgi:hypothetical protein
VPVTVDMFSTTCIYEYSNALTGRCASWEQNRRPKTAVAQQKAGWHDQQGSV